MSKRVQFRLGGSKTSFFLPSVLAAIALFVIILDLVGNNLRLYLYIYFGVIVFTLGALLFFFRRDLAASVLLVFCILFSAFHFGLLFADIAGAEVHRLFAGVLGWYLRDEVVFGAYHASLLFLLGAVIGGTITLKLLRRPLQGRANNRVRWQRANSLILFFFSLSVAAWLIVVVGVLGIRNYAEYNFIARGDGSGAFRFMLVVLYPLIAALFFLAINSSNKLRPAFLIFLAFGIVAFPLGMRGEVLFPLAMIVSVLMAQGRLYLSPWAILTCVYFVSIASSFGRIFRAGTDLGEAMRGASGITGLAEMGGSLRPVVEVRSWLDSGVDVLRWGETYYAPFERTFLRIFPISERESALTDDRLMNTLLVARTGGNYGFSIAGEALVNFGQLGCAVVGAVSGILLAIYGRQIENGKVPIVLSAVVFGFFIHVRQGFVTAYGSALLFLIVCLAASLVREHGIGLKVKLSPNSRGAL